MSTRKIIRNGLRRFGTKYLSAEWNAFQIKKVGVTRRQINQAKGTKPKHLWRSRIEAALPA
jgi:hypothetical protein